MPIALRCAARWAPKSTLRWLEPSTQLVGLAGEQLAARFLSRRGWRILARRLSTESAEVDLVASHDDQLVCVEVKTGRVPFEVDASGTSVPILTWRPGRRASKKQLTRLLRAARRLALNSNLRPRVDLVEVLVESGGRRMKIFHHTNCQRPPGTPHESPDLQNWP